MVYIDSHCHLFEVKDYVLPQDIYPVIVGYSHGSNKKAFELAKKYSYPFALGIAPQSTIKEGISHLDQWVEFIRSSKPNAVGEVGLDYKWATNLEHVKMQKKTFSAMISLSEELDVPVVIHSRNNPTENEVPKNAIDDVIKMVEERPFLMHFYSGNYEQALRIVQMGGYISILAMRSKERRKVIESVPLERLLIESDCPYVGRTPDLIKDAVSYIAEIKKLDHNLVEEQTAKNTQKFFGFKM
ncbi:MAG: TatD family hydrolase [Candidatus Bilamarchaeum sp.]